MVYESVLDGSTTYTARVIVSITVGVTRRASYLYVCRHHPSARRAPMWASMSDPDLDDDAQTLICAINWYTGVESI